MESVGGRGAQGEALWLAIAMKCFAANWWCERVGVDIVERGVRKAGGVGGRGCGRDRARHGC